MRRVSKLEVSRVLKVILTFPACEDNVDDVFLLFDIGGRVRPVAHRLYIDENWAISDHVMVLLGDKMRIAEPNARCFQKALLEHKYLRVELL